MRKIYIAVFMICLLLTVVTGASGDVSQGKEKENPVTRARDAVLSYFTPASGTVTDAAGGSVTVRFEGGENIKKGMRFNVYRKGKPFYHPVTKELLGSTEDMVGRVEVKEVKAPEGLHFCSVIKGDLRTGDTVRATAAKIKLSFFQEKKSDWTLSEAFYTSLKDSERFEILESYTPAYKPEDLSRLSRDHNAEAVLLFSTPVKDEKRVLNIKMYWAEDSKLFAEIEETEGKYEFKMFAPGEEFIYDSLADKEPWGKYSLARGQIFAMGDVDGNGIAELVVSDGNSISIYDLKEELREIVSIKGSPQEKQISIDVLDTNNNGRAEIFITSMSGDSSTGNMKAEDISIRSFVIEYDPALGFSKVKDNMPYFFRVSGKTLLMQKFGTGKIFDGPVYEGELKDGNYQPKRQLALPPDVNIYGFTFIDWQNNGQNQVVTFDDDGYLILYDSQGHVIWKSGKSYGKFAFSFEKETYSVANPVIKKAVRGRLVSVLSGRGQEVIVVNKVPVLSKVPGLGNKGAEIYSLWWDGGEMDEKLLLSEMPGNITDYWGEGKQLFFFAKGSLFSLIKNAVSGELSRKSVLYYYKLGEQ